MLWDILPSKFHSHSVFRVATLPCRIPGWSSVATLMHAFLPWTAAAGGRSLGINAVQIGMHELSFGGAHLHGTYNLRLSCDHAVKVVLQSKHFYFNAF